MTPHQQTAPAAPRPPAPDADLRERLDGVIAAALDRMDYEATPRAEAAWWRNAIREALA